MALVAVYAAVFAAFAFVVVRFGWEAVPEGFHWLYRPGSQHDLTGEWVWEAPIRDATGWSKYAIRTLEIVLFVAFQAAIVLGIGFVRLRPKTRVGGAGRLLTLLITLLIAISMMSLLTIVLVLLFLEFGGRIEPEGFALRVEGLVLSSNETGDLMAKLLIGAWFMWFVVAVLALWRADATTLIGRVFRVILGASWIEFVLALALDLAARPRYSDCPCAAGSWLALLVLVPLMLLVVGPAIALLLLREWRLARRDPRRPRRILLRKSRPTA